jgi:hypothetical protein
MDECIQEAYAAVIAGSFRKNILCFRLGKAIARKCRVVSAITSSVSSAAESCFLLGLSRGGVQTFQYQHGGGQGYRNKAISRWFNSQTDFFFYYGRNPDQTHIVTTAKTCVISAGSHLLHAAQKRTDKKATPTHKTLTVLSVTPTPLGHRSYFPELMHSDLFNYMRWRDLLGMMVRLHSKFDGRLRFLIKSAPVAAGSADYFCLLTKRAGKGCVDLATGGTFAHHLASADIVVIDSPETTLLQAVLARKPIVFYFKGGYQLEPDAKTMLERRVYWANSLNEVESALRRIADDYPAALREKNDNSFQNSYAAEIKPPAFFLKHLFFERSALPPTLPKAF